MNTTYTSAARKITKEQIRVLVEEYGHPKDALPELFREAQALMRLLFDQQTSLKALDKQRKSPQKRRNLSGVMKSEARRDYSIQYAEYIKSEKWARHRRACIRRAGGRCQLCNATGSILHAHHRTYDRLGDELPEDLTCLCEACHSMFHKHGKLSK